MTRCNSWSSSTPQIHFPEEVKGEGYNLTRVQMSVRLSVFEDYHEDMRNSMGILANKQDTPNSVMFPSEKRLPESLYTAEQINMKKCSRSGTENCQQSCVTSKVITLECLLQTRFGALRVVQIEAKHILMVCNTYRIHFQKQQKQTIH